VKPWAVAGIPFAFSLSLSAATVGGTVGWQDSGFYLTAVKEMGVLYPPGFVLYVLLCKAWTLLLFFVDFTVAVHLFSSVCCAGAAGALAMGVREFLAIRAKEAPGPLAGAVGAATGCLAACGYTFWAAAIYAKTYALYYLALSLLLWSMVRAAASRRPRDFTVVAALIGLSWAAHPSATNAGPALVLFVAAHRSVLGGKGILWRAGLAAACAAGPALILPALSARGPVTAFAEIRGAGEALGYLVGTRYLEIPGVFGLEADRAVAAGQYFWEEFLGVGATLVVLGAARLGREDRALLGGVAAWVLPILAVSTLFKIEGQQDFWLVAAWLALHGVAALGLEAAGRRWGRGAVAGLAAAGAAWAIAVNYPLVKQRDYDLAEVYGRTYLENLDPGSVLVLGQDDSIGNCQYLQIVKGFRTDVTVVNVAFLEYGKTGAPGWYDRSLLRRNPSLREPDYAGLRRRFPRAPGAFAGSDAAFANANVSAERPVFFEIPPPAETLRPDFALVPAGPLWKMVPRGSEKPDASYWRLPLTPEEVLPRLRRRRGIRIRFDPGGVRTEREAHEHRFLRLLLRARRSEADLLFREGTAESFRKSAALYDSILRLDPKPDAEGEVVYSLGLVAHALRVPDQAERLLRRALQFPLPARMRAGAFLYLGEISRGAGRTAEADGLFSRALEVPGVDEEFRAEMERRIRGQGP
jgi:hypothetical protein